MTAPQAYTATDVLELVLEAYARGRYDADQLDTAGTWAEHDEPWLTRELRVRARLDEMQAAHERDARRRGVPPAAPYRGGPVDFETGEPLRTHLAAA